MPDPDHPPFQVSWHVITWRFLMVFEGPWKSLKVFEGFLKVFDSFCSSCLMFFSPMFFDCFLKGGWCLFQGFWCSFFVWGFLRFLIVFEGFWKFLMGYSNQSKNALHFEHKYSIYPPNHIPTTCFRLYGGRRNIPTTVFLLWPTSTIINKKKRTLQKIFDLL